MCLFPVANSNPSGVAAKKGILNFDCGACPECLRKKANSWALRAVFEAKQHLYNCMITLTYDKYKYNKSGHFDGKHLEEMPVDPTIEVSKRHIQLFIKRLRKHFSGQKIKYICAAEYGSKTHRAHYHLILFGVRFPDLRYYKKSSRGNVIYNSSLLEELWSMGICTVDNINVSEASARYCTKYCAKSRSEDTFMLFSQGIGIDSLMKSFNGECYWVNGRRYPIPRSVWQRYIMRKYKEKYPRIDYRYVNRDYSFPDKYSYLKDIRYVRAFYNRAWYRLIRDKDPVYQHYLAYWKEFAEQHKACEQPVLQRIYLLSHKHYWYKMEALNAYSLKKSTVIVPPRSRCISAREHYLAQLHYKTGCHLPLPSRLIRASDTIATPLGLAYRRQNGYSPLLSPKILINFEKTLDNPFYL